MATGSELRKGASILSCLSDGAFSTGHVIVRTCVSEIDYQGKVRLEYEHGKTDERHLEISL